MICRQNIAASDIKALIAFFETSPDMTCIEDVLHVVIRAVSQKPLLPAFLEQVNMIGGCHIFVNLLQRLVVNATNSVIDKMMNFNTRVMTNFVSLLRFDIVSQHYQYLRSLRWNYHKYIYPAYGLPLNRDISYRQEYKDLNVMPSLGYNKM